MEIADTFSNFYQSQTLIVRPSAGSMMGPRLRRWPNIEPALDCAISHSVLYPINLY